MRELRLTAVLAVVATVLVGCAAQPAASVDPAWQPPAWGLAGTVAVGTSAPTGEWPFHGERLVNDKTGFYARFAYAPGDQPFNDRIDRILWDAITSTGEKYTPTAGAPGTALGGHGCIAGSSRWAPTQVVAEVAPGAVGPAALVVCDALPAFGPFAGQVVRTVTTGALGEIVSDVSTTLYADTSANGLIEGGDLWNEQAVPTVWRAVVDRMRRDAGSLSLAAIADPLPDQHALMDASVRSAVIAPDGLYVTVPGGLTAPELTALGVPAATEPFTAVIPFADIDAGLSDTGRAVTAAAATPFQRPAGPSFPQRPDCELLVCVALTYDDGPTGLTPQLVETLIEKEAPATFYMPGDAVRNFPDIARQVAEAGNEIEGHTLTHARLTDLSRAGVHDEIWNGAKEIELATGVKMTHFRPPWGQYNNAVMAAAGLPAMLWDLDTFDWTGRPAEEIVNLVVTEAKAGGVILFHDTQQNTVASAGTIIDQLRDRGFTMVTVLQLFGGEISPGVHRRL